MMSEQPNDNKLVPDLEVEIEQQKVMTVISPDGRPPEMASTRINWKRATLIAVVGSLLGVALLIVTLGPTAGGLASILLVGYIALTVPVWGAGLMRGQEEKIAHEIAERRVHPHQR
ncbi:MAG: hypothetical protein KF691_01495 [Phycisphaeraceae bacterium]|nr:hypothetical protein [Phycisphaeraceae bacterium]